MKYYTLETIRRAEFQMASQPKPFPGRWPTRCYWRVGSEEYFGKPAPCRVAIYRRLATRAAAPYFMEFDRSGAIYVTGGTPQTSPLFSFYYHWQRPSVLPDHLLVPLFRKRIAGYTVLSPYSVLKREYVDDWRRYASDVLEKRLKPKSHSSKPTKGVQLNRTLSVSDGYGGSGSVYTLLSQRSAEQSATQWPPRRSWSWMNDTGETITAAIASSDDFTEPEE